MDPIARARLNSSLLETLAALLERRARDPRVRGVTLTAVQVANDLAVAKVYYSILEGEEQRRIAQKGLENVAGFLRGEVGRILHIRNAPQLRSISMPLCSRGTASSRCFAKSMIRMSRAVRAKPALASVQNQRSRRRPQNVPRMRSENATA